MERCFDYFKGKVDKTNKKRIIFINRMSYLMQEFDSTSNEVNELIDWLFCLSEGVPYHDPTLDVSKNDYNLKPLEYINRNRLIKQVWNNDMHLYSYAMLLHEYNYWSNKDVLTDIIKEIYFRLDKIIHPSDGSHRDYEDIKYYVEVDYEDEEQ